MYNMSHDASFLEIEFARLDRKIEESVAQIPAVEKDEKR